MTLKYLTAAVWLLVLVGFCVLAWRGGASLARRSRSRRRTQRKESEFPLSAFSVMDHPAASRGGAQGTPQDEAEVYLIYGKTKEAARVLQAALKARRISQADVDAFWAKHPDASPENER